jgi:RNA polymerase sigma-70 factor (ECF subfamily)
MTDPRIVGAWQSARSACPGVDLAESEFATYVAERLPSAAGQDEQEAESEIELQWADLYLACACANGDKAALSRFDEAFSEEIDAAVKRIGAAIEHDELRQLVWVKLFVAAPGQKPRITEYRGRGKLRTWLRITAMRVALDRNALAVGREIPFEGDALSFLIGGGEDPELKYFRHAYTEEFRMAFGDAFEGLESRDRNLLRYAFGEGLSIDAIASVYSVHRATAARWVSKAHAAVLDGVRQALQSRLRVTKKELSSILRLIASQLDITLDTYLNGVRPE